MRGILDLAKEVLRLPASVGVPEDSDLVGGTSTSDPIYAGVIGAIILAHKYGGAKHRIKFNLAFGGFFGSLKALFSKIIP